MINVNRSTIVGHWVHAHEEDWEGNMVFRREGTSLPPSRGRITLDLRPDGSAELGKIAATDGIETTGGEWDLKGESLLVRDDQGETRNWYVIASEPDRLVLRPPH